MAVSTLSDNANQAVIEGVLVESVELRATPSGLYIARFELEHHSQTVETPPVVQYEVRMAIVAMGALAERCRTLVPGARVRIEGRLNQKRWIRNGVVRWGPLELIARAVLALDSHPVLPITGNE